MLPEQLADATNAITPDFQSDEVISPFGTIEEKRTMQVAKVVNGRLVFVTETQTLHVVVPDAIYERGQNEYNQRWVQMVYSLEPGRFYEIQNTQDDRKWRHQYVTGRGEGLIIPQAPLPRPDFTGLSGQALLDAMRAAVIAAYQAGQSFIPNPMRGGGWILSNTWDGTFRGVFQRGTRTRIIDWTDANPRPGPF